MPQLDAAFAALADPIRRAILARWATGKATVQDLSRPFPISQPAISRHLRLQEDAGLIETRVDGTSRPRRLKVDAVEELRDWLGQYRALREARYARPDDVLADHHQDDSPLHPPPTDARRRHKDQPHPSVPRPPALVFRAHTEPAMIRRWMIGPDGWTMSACQIDPQQALLSWRRA